MKRIADNRPIGPVALSADLGVFDRFADGWIACIRQVLRHGHESSDNGRLLREHLNVSLTARSCVLQDLVEVGASSDRLAHMLEKYSSLDVLPEYDMSYGRLFRWHADTDQISWLVSRLRWKAETKSATIGFHVPGDDILSCISLLDCKIRCGALHVTAVFRSQNVFGSQPGNACALNVLQAEIAERVGVDAGPLTLHVISAHIYQDDWLAAKDLTS